MYALLLAVVLGIQIDATIDCDNWDTSSVTDYREPIVTMWSGGSKGDPIDVVFGIEHPRGTPYGHLELSRAPSMGWHDNWANHSVYPVPDGEIYVTVWLDGEVHDTAYADCSAPQSPLVEERLERLEHEQRVRRILAL